MQPNNIGLLLLVIAVIWLARKLERDAAKHSEREAAAWAAVTDISKRVRKLTNAIAGLLGEAKGRAIQDLEEDKD